MNDITRVNDLDNNLSLLYKKAISLNVPIRYLLIKPSERKINDVSEIINRTKEGIFEYNTIFNFIADHDNNDDIVKLYDIVKRFLGPQLYITDFLCAYIQVKGMSGLDLNVVQDMLQDNGEQKVFRDYDALAMQFEDWKVEYQTELDRDTKITRELWNQQMTLFNIQPLPHSDLDIESITFMYDIKVDYDNLKDLFVDMTLNYNIPFVEYVNSNGDKQFRVFKGDNEDYQLNYSHIDIPQSALMKRDCLYVKIWSGEQQNREAIISASTKEAFQIATISYLDVLSVLRVRITSPYRKKVDKSDLVRRLHSCINLPVPDPSKISESKMLGNYTIYNVNMCNEVFHYLILNHPIFRQYLYIEESSTKSLPAKTRLNINYRPSFLEASLLSREKKRLSTKSPLVASCFRELINEEKTVKQGDQTVIIQPNSYAVKFKINRSANIDLAEQFINISSRLMNLYNDFHNKVINLYLKFIPSFNKVLEYEAKYKTINEVKVKGRDINARQGGPSDNLQILQSKAPDLFVTKYARECMKNLQPIILEEEEVEEYEKKTFIDKSGNVANYKVMRFPINDPKYIFACPYEYAPYVGVKVNKKLSNKDVYPYIPCCYLEDQSQKNTAYSKMLQGDNQTMSQKSYVSSSSKMQSEGRYGLIPDVLTDLFSLYEQDNNNTFYRLGVKTSNCSFIHVICEALNIPHSEEDVQTLRSKLLDNVYMDIVRQELYDYSKDDILKMINDPNEYFDPLKLYRLLEEHFQVNIYMFNNRELDLYTMEYANLYMLPRYKKMHLRNKHDYPNTVCIIVSEGMEQPQCELIVEDNGGSYKKVFPASMNDLLYDVYVYVCRNLTWSVEDAEIISRDRYYNSIDYQFLKDVNLISQVIDQYGKCRMIYFSYQGVKYQMYCPPCQPFNVPSYVPNSEYPKLSDVEALLSSPDGYYSDSQTCGVSYDCGDIQQAFFFPIQRPTVEPSLPSCKKPIQMYDLQNSISKTMTYHKLRKMASFLQQIFVFILIDGNYDMAHAYRHMYVMDVGDDQDRSWTFIPQRILHKPEQELIDVVRSSYKPEMFPRSFKRGEVLNTLMKQVPGLFKDDKIVLEDIRVFSGIKYHLLNFLQKNTASDFIQYSKMKYYNLKDYYSTVFDYPNRDHEFLLLSEGEYKSWYQKNVDVNIIHQRSISKIQGNIQTSLKYTDYQIKEPFLYYQPYNNLIGANIYPAVDSYYLIQSVAEGSLKRAINLAYRWYDKKINSGFFCPAYLSDQLPSYKIYFINQSGQLSMKEDHSIGDSHLMVIEYTTDTYGSILPLE